MREAVMSLVHERRLWIAITVFIISTGVMLTGWWGYRTFSIARDRRAQLALVEQLDRLNTVRANSSADPIAWEALEVGFGRGYVEHSSSSLAPFFLAFQAEALAHMNKHDEALQVLDKGVGLMRPNTDVYYLYAIKRAVMRLDSADEKISAQGKRELLDLAQTGRNSSQGLAWYHLLEYAIIHGDEELRKLAHNKVQIYPVLAQQVRDMFESSAEGNE